MRPAAAARRAASRAVATAAARRRRQRRHDVALFDERARRRAPRRAGDVEQAEAKVGKERDDGAAVLRGHAYTHNHPRHDARTRIKRGGHQRLEAPSLVVIQHVRRVGAVEHGHDGREEDVRLLQVVVDGAGKLRLCVRNVVILKLQGALVDDIVGVGRRRRRRARRRARLHHRGRAVHKAHQRGQLLGRRTREAECDGRAYNEAAQRNAGAARDARGAQPPRHLARRGVEQAFALVNVVDARVGADFEHRSEPSGPRSRAATPRRRRGCGRQVHYARMRSLTPQHKESLSSLHYTTPRMRAAEAMSP